MIDTKQNKEMKEEYEKRLSSFKRHVKKLNKLLWCQEVSSLDDLFEEYSKTIPENANTKEWFYIRICDNDSLENSKKTHDYFFGFYGRVKDKYAGKVNSFLSDDSRDSIRFEVIDHGEGVSLLVASNSLISSSLWCNLIVFTGEDADYFARRFDKQ